MTNNPALCFCMDVLTTSFSLFQVIAAEGENKAARALKEASDIINESSSALQLRYLQTLNTISAEKNSTIIFPLPIEFLTHFMKKWGRTGIPRLSKCLALKDLGLVDSPQRSLLSKVQTYPVQISECTVLLAWRICKDFGDFCMIKEVYSLQSFVKFVIDLKCGLH